ncbi:MAG TPA: NAD(P)H-dependent oxidoreductase [Pyrinomonadaceae bacterium]|nr:NAD(P)H-dependent oxidoreductase [Pyrinomonadaceae bacterium]
MSEKIKLLGIAGSLRKTSTNRGALRAAAELLPEGAEMEIFELNDIPPYNEDHEADPPAIVAEFKKKIREADAIVFATPEYNYSVSGVLKNAIDWASRPYGDSAWEGKPAAIMGVSGGAIATARAQYDLRKSMVFLNMHPLNRPEVMIGNSGKKFDADGNLTDDATKEIIAKQMKALVQLTRRFSEAAKTAAS